MSLSFPLLLTSSRIFCATSITASYFDTSQTYDQTFSTQSRSLPKSQLWGDTYEQLVHRMLRTIFVLALVDVEHDYSRSTRGERSYQQSAHARSTYEHDIGDQLQRSDGYLGTGTLTSCHDHNLVLPDDLLFLPKNFLLIIVTPAEVSRNT